VQAISLSPAQQEIDFTPNLEQEFVMTVGNGGGRETKIILSFEGELAKYIEFNEEAVQLSKDEAHKFRFKIKLPENIPKPGRQLVKIHAAEEPIKATGKILPVTSVTALLWINVPYTGKYAELKVTTKNVNLGEPVPFTIFMKNLGEEEITSAITTIKIYDINENLIETLTTTKTNLAKQSEKETTITFPTKEQKPGEYKAIAILNYDGQLAEAQEQEFFIGTLHVAIIDHTKIFKKDTVNKFEIEVANKWNSPIQHLQGEIQIQQNGNSIGSLLKTPSTSLSPWESKTLTTFWDTKGLESGTYTATITLHYHNKTTTKTVDLQLKKDFAFNTTIILTSIIILILLIDFIIWLVHKRRENEED
tara:strand:+ start:411 stop:1499 length:1089 start_codon:yes stop_codon:yes gene_type:complete